MRVAPIRYRTYLFLQVLFVLGVGALFVVFWRVALVGIMVAVLAACRRYYLKRASRRRP